MKQLCRNLREFGEKPYIYVLLLADKGKSEYTLEYLEAGADDFLTKPILSGVLVAHINRLVKRTAPIVPVPVPVPVPRTNVQAPGDTQQLPR